MRTLLLTLVLTGCSSKQAEPPPKADPTAESAAAESKRQAWHDEIAKMVLSAISADDFEQLRPLFRIDGVPEAETTEIANLGADSVKQLREELAYLKIDLAKATFLRVVVTGDHIHLFDVFLEANGQVYKTHFSVMVTRAGYSLLGIANWIVSETK